MSETNSVANNLNSSSASLARKPPAAHAWTHRALLCFLLLGSVGAQAQTPEQEVLGVVTALFDGMRNKDAESLRALFLAEGRLGTDSPREWINSVTSSESYLDEVTFDEIVLIDDTLAMAWTPYNLFVNDVFHHCGVDVFTLRKTEGAWKILQIDDTRRTEGCEPDRRGD